MKKTKTNGANSRRLEIRAAFSPRSRVQVSWDPDAKTRTKQSFIDECDINQIMARFQKTGALEHANLNRPQYGFATSIDFNESMQIVKTAQDMFDGLPSSIRSRFQNDPGQFLDFVQDAQNKPEMAKMGLLTPEATQRIEEPLAAPQELPQDASPPENEAKVQLST